MFCKKGVLRNFAKFTGDHLCQSFFFNKVAGLESATLLKKRSWHRCFPVNFTKSPRTSFLTEHLQWLLLHYDFLCCSWYPNLLMPLKIKLHTTKNSCIRYCLGVKYRNFIGKNELEKIKWLTVSTCVN